MTDHHHEVYKDLLKKQASQQGRALSAFSDAVADVVFKASKLAMGDSQRRYAKARIAPAPTGGGKTNASIAFGVSGLIADPSFTASYVVEQMEQADRIYREILELLPLELHSEVAIWTTAHDKGISKEKAKAEHGFEPYAQFSKADLGKARICICTHKKLENDLEKAPRPGLLYDPKGRPRSVVFVDETPSIAKLYEATPGIILTFRDRVKGTDPEHPYVPLLSDIGYRMEKAYRETSGGSFRGVDIIQGYEETLKRLYKEDMYSLERFSGRYPSGEKTDELNRFYGAVKFIKAASQGYVFLCINNLSKFIAYELGFRPFPGLVILDATFDLSGMALLGRDYESLEVPKVDYRKLELFSIETPKAQRGRIKDILKKMATARPYAQWIKDTVLENTQSGELALIVTHNDLFNLELLPVHHNPKEPWDLEGRRVLTLNWGSGVGVNWAKDAGAVFLFGEFYIPRRTIVGSVLGGKDLVYTKAQDLGNTEGRYLNGTYGDFSENHRLRWSIQLGARGRMRQVDPEGVAAPMRLYSSMPLETFLKMREIAFESAPLPTRVLTREKSVYPKEKPLLDRRIILEEPKEPLGDPKGGYGTSSPVIDGLVDLLTQEPSGTTLWSTDLEASIGLTSCKLKGYLRQPRIRPVVEAYSWRLVTKKEMGLPGKGLGITRGP